MDSILLYCVAILVWVSAFIWSDFKLNRARKEIAHLKEHVPQHEYHD